MFSRAMFGRVLRANSQVDEVADERSLRLFFFDEAADERSLSLFFVDEVADERSLSLFFVDEVADERSLGCIRCLFEEAGADIPS